MKKYALLLILCFGTLFATSQIILEKETVGTNHYYAVVKAYIRYVGDTVSIAGLNKENERPTIQNVAFVGKGYWTGSYYKGEIEFYCLSDRNYFWAFRLWGAQPSETDTFFTYRSRPCFTPMPDPPILSQIDDTSFTCSVRIPHDAWYAGTMLYSRFTLKDLITSQEEIIGDENYAKSIEPFTIVLRRRIKRGGLLISKEHPILLSATVYYPCGVEEVIVQTLIPGQPSTWKLFPNPCTNYVRLLGDLDVIGKKIECFSMDGRLVFQSTVSSVSEVFDVSRLSRGTYIMRVSGRTMRFTKL